MASNTSATSNSSGWFTQSGIIRILGLLAFDAFIIWFISQALRNGFYSLTAVIVVVGVLVNTVFLVPRLAPVRWMVTGLSLMIIFVIYPIIFTVSIAFTNYGDGHLLTKEQALDQILTRSYLPEEGKAYGWTAFKSEDGQYALWLQDADGSAFLAKPGEELQPGVPGENGVGELDAAGIPVSIEGFQRLNAILATTDQELPNIQFGVAPQTVQIRSPSEAAELRPRYTYDEESDTIYDIQTDAVYENVDGHIYGCEW